MKTLSFPEGNFTEKIANEWMLVAAGDAENGNAMTASWGGVGSLWNKRVAFVFVRPQRYTHDFITRSKTLSLSFFEPSFRPMLATAGTVSGRDTDKMATLGLTPRDRDGTVVFDEASLTLTGRVLYAAPLSEASFIDRETLDKNYPERDLHTVFVAEIVGVYENTKAAH